MEKTLIKMQFNPTIAKDVGTDAAIIYANIEYWCDKNLKDYKTDIQRMPKEKAEMKNNIKENKVWTYNSHKAWIEFFPHLSESQIKRCLTKLKEKGYVLVSQLNAKNYDRTNWYSPTSQDSLIEETESSNQVDDLVSPIPDNKPNNKPNNNPPTPKTLKEESFDIEQAFEKFWRLYPNKKSKKKSLSIFLKLSKETAEKILQVLPEHIKQEQWIKDDGKFIPHPATWLNQERWEDELEPQVPKIPLDKLKAMTPSEVTVEAHKFGGPDTPEFKAEYGEDGFTTYLEIRGLL